jgi:hypothetical protein
MQHITCLKQACLKRLGASTAVLVLASPTLQEGGCPSRLTTN